MNLEMKNEHVGFIKLIDYKINKFIAIIVIFIINDLVVLLLQAFIIYFKYYHPSLSSAILFNNFILIHFLA